MTAKIFSIAKYFTLLEMGITENRLRITYVKALTLNQAHMVLTYYATPQAMPLILDNLLPTIRAAVERKDLIPVYSFNGSHLWLAKAKGSSGEQSDSSKLSPWADLTKRMLELPL
ncbi:hypothetical protein [Methylocucumis oryzae]|uniref:hypothetical protein n=1 Tax=Methylocucumis oryzae TaxID=1632867 RepID=UPI000A8DAFFB|nr:hypothetical protein [Methylocucumis oryzae]